MMTVRLDQGGALKVVWPLKDRDVIGLGETFLKQEAVAANGSAGRLLPLIQQALEEARSGSAGAVSGETSRAISAQQVQNALTEAIPLMEEGIVHLKSRHVQNLARLEEWGLKTKQSGKKITVRKPTNRSQWLDLLPRFVAKEQSLPEDQRLQVPSPERLSNLAGLVVDQGQAKSAAKAQRQIGVAARSSSVQTLLDRLQAAAVLLVVERFQGSVTRELEQWGYKVIAYRSKAPMPEEV